MSIKLQLPKLTDLKPRINVIGVGGAGCNAINNMISAGLTGCDFVVANTDAQSLAASSAEHKLQLGVNLTEGLGAGLLVLRRRPGVRRVEPPTLHRIRGVSVATTLVEQVVAMRVGMRLIRERVVIVVHWGPPVAV